MIFNLLSKAEDLFYNNALSKLKSTNVQDAIDEVSSQLSGQIQTATGSALTLTDSAEGYLMDINVEGKSVQDGTPTPDAPVGIKSVSDCVEMRQGYYPSTTGIYATSNNGICNITPIPCAAGDTIKLNYEVAGMAIFSFYNDSGYLSYIAGEGSSTSASVIVPSGATHFNISVTSSGITPDNAGKIELTINDMYVLQVKSVSKNLYPLENEPFTLVKSTARTKSLKFTALKNGTYTVSFKVSNANLSGYQVGVQIRDETGILKSAGTRSNGVVSTTLTANGISQLYFFIDSTATDTATATISDIQIEYGDTVTDYVPHKESVSTVLLPEPLRSNIDDTVKDLIAYRDNSYKTIRRNVQEVLNGTSEGTWTLETVSGVNAFYLLRNTATKNKGVLSDKYLYNGSLAAAQNNIYVNWLGRLIICDNSYSTVDEWIAHLKSSPVTVQYETVTEVIESLDQTPFYQIPTYKGTTVNTTDRLQPTISGSYPVSDTAGVASKGYAVSQALRELKYDVSVINENLTNANEDITEIDDYITKLKHFKYSVAAFDNVPLDSAAVMTCVEALPIGFTKDNTVVVAVGYLLKESEGATGDMQYTPYVYSNGIYPKVYISDSSICAEAMHDTYKYADIKVVIMRTDI